MAINNQIENIIEKYLRREETVSEREQLYEWYDSIETGLKPLKIEEVNTLKEIAKRRLFNEINLYIPKKAVIPRMWYGIAASILLFVAVFLSVKYINQRDNYIALNSADIEKLAPESGKATMTLSTGEVITLDTLGDQETASLGSSTISNNGSGGLVYKAGNVAAAEHTIGTLQTGRAAQYNIELSDGTRVWLNAKSQLSFPEKFGTGDRIVKLSGEGYFEVKKTMRKSKFIVQSDGQNIEVLGTKFNINGYLPVVIKTTVAEGSVRVTPNNKAITAIILKPNQQAILAAGNIKQIDVDASRSIAWKDGYFTFDGNNTQEILNEIGDWYGIDVEYNNPTKAVKYTGKIPKNISLSRLVMLLGYQDISVKAFKDKNNQLKLIVN